VKRGGEQREQPSLFGQTTFNNIRNPADATLKAYVHWAEDRNHRHQSLDTTENNGRLVSLRLAFGHLSQSGIWRRSGSTVRKNRSGFDHHEPQLSGLGVFVVRSGQLRVRADASHRLLQVSRQSFRKGSCERKIASSPHSVWSTTSGPSEFDPKRQTARLRTATNGSFRWFHPAGGLSCCKESSSPRTRHANRKKASLSTPLAPSSRASRHFLTLPKPRLNPPLGVQEPLFAAPLPLEERAPLPRWYPRECLGSGVATHSSSNVDL
jgi:hypothetical protein